MTYAELLTEGKRRLREYEIETPETDASLFLQAASGKTAAELFRDAPDPVSEETEERFFSMITRRTRHEPAQYVLEEQWFCGLLFKVNKSVLIPRPETELLVEAACPEVAGKRVLDLCTGSGCIAVALAKLSAPAFVAASDCSPEALVVAKENAKQNEADITFFCGDLFETVQGTFDVIVSNPPYISEEELRTLMPEVRDKEPHLALSGGEDGLFFYRRIVKEAIPFLNAQGKLMMEIGYNQGEQVSELLREQGYREVVVKKDYAGLSRMVFAVR